MIRGASAVLVALAIGCTTPVDPASSFRAPADQTPASTPSFTIPNTVGPVSAPVGGTAGDALRVTNSGDQPLMISVQLDSQSANSAQWQVAMCVAPTSCALAVGASIDIPVSLHPLAHGSLDTTITVLGPPAAGSLTATLVGVGVGGFLRVDQPTAPMFDHDFGTIAKGQTATFAVDMTNIGNDNITVTPSNPGVPFTVLTTPVLIGKNAGMGTFDIKCSSATALAQTDATVDLVLSANTYDRNTDKVTVHCAVANTTVQVTNPLDFRELRVGDPAGTIDVEITNPPGGGNVSITRVALIGAPSQLTLDPVTVPATIADGNQLTTQLHLATTDVVTLSNVTLEIDVVEGATVTLKLPVTGNVGIPSAVVLPERLDLGTVCIGTTVAAEVTMTNTGSVKLLMQRPTMTSTSFVPLYTKPTDYPATGAPLLPMDKAMVGVMPSNLATGVVAGTLEWPVDVPGGVFKIPVTLKLLDEGTAVSPARLPFSPTEIAAPPGMQQMITLENCGPNAASIRYDHVEAISGTASAWLLDPPAQERALLPGEQTRIRVAFSPNQPGPHKAQLPISIDGTETIVELEGDATGTLPDKTSFYACDCSGAGAPQRGWPIVVACAFMLRRRRSRSSRAC